MKKIFLIIGMAAVMSNAGCGYECNQRLERIANALERIANSMEKQEKQQIQVQKVETPKKQEITHLNGRSLKAIPTIDTECIDECMMEYPPSRRTDCIETKCGGSNEKSSFY